MADVFEDDPPLWLCMTLQGKEINLNLHSAHILYIAASEY